MAQNRIPLFRSGVTLILLVGSVILWNHVASVGAITDMARLGLIGASVIILATIYLLLLSSDQRSALLRSKATQRLSPQLNSGAQMVGYASTEHLNTRDKTRLRYFARLIIPWIVLPTAFFLGQHFHMTHNERLCTFAVAALVGGAMQFFVLTPEQRARFRKGSNKSA